MEEKKENKLENLKGKCIVISKEYGEAYYDGNAGYSSEFSRAKIYNENEIPQYIKDNPREKIIHLDTEEGLSLLLNEFKRSQHFAEIYGPRVRDAEEIMEKLFGFDLVRKYIELHNKWYNPLIGISRDTEKKILKEIVREKNNSN